MMAIADDPRLPSSLGPVIWFRPLGVAALEAQLGEKAEAEKTLKMFHRYREELLATFSAEDSRHELFASSQQNAQAWLELIGGDAQAALANASAVVGQIDKVKFPSSDTNTARPHDNMLRGALTTAVEAAIRLGHYAEAETQARRLATVRVDPNSGDDPQEHASRVAAYTAHAVAMQARHDEARTVLEPALAYYMGEQKAGATGTTFRHDYTYALYVSALARGADRAQRDADLAEAAKVLGGASAEARQLVDMRELAGLITAARTSSHD